MEFPDWLSDSLSGFTFIKMIYIIAISFPGMAFLVRSPSQGKALTIKAENDYHSNNPDC
ncbi:hypothetical protein [Paenibacillus physcomitrellae]|uniref:hypothetical protein n=1 Tax=Paenibacillus physcomitrellae TaxID=1619311 RepID=UPI00157F989C|nr:hypothetical protein [Paenibacillus physcomitrellae]